MFNNFYCKCLLTKWNIKDCGLITNPYKVTRMFNKSIQNEIFSLYYHLNDKR